MAPPIQMPDVWRVMAEAAGGVTKLARRLGVSDRTVRRWATNEVEVPPHSQVVVGMLAKTLEVAAPRFDSGPRYWTVTNKGDVRCRKMADKHYTRQTPGHPMWTRPGYNFVLYFETPEGGQACWCWWRPKWEAGQERFDKLRALECTIFRNESRLLSSDLIRDAVLALSTPEARKELSHEAPDTLLLLTGVSSTKTAKRRSKRSRPGECFYRAGWTDFEHKKGRADVWLALPAKGRP